MKIDYTPTDWTGTDTDNDAPETVRLRLAIEATLGVGAVPFTSAPTGQPLDTETVTIGADVYEFCTAAGSVASDSRIGVVIAGTADGTMANLVAAINATYRRDAHPTLFRTNGTTAAHANGTENVRALHDDSGNVLYLFEADAPGGNVTPKAASSRAVTDAATNFGPFKILNTNLAVGVGNAPLLHHAPLKHVVVAGDLTQTQPLRIPTTFTPKVATVVVLDANGRQKMAADARAVVGTAVGSQQFVDLYLNAGVSGDQGALTESLRVETSNGTNGVTDRAYFHGTDRAKRLVQVEITAKTAPSGGTLVFDAIKTAEDGTETTLASAVNVAGISAHDPTNITFDDAALPQNIAFGEKVELRLTGGAGLTTPLQATITPHYFVLVEATDILVIDIYGE